MTTRMTCVTLGVCFFVMAVAWAVPEDVRFGGGAFDGWDRYAMTNSQGLGGALVTLSSGTEQTFDFTVANADLAAVTITAEEPAGKIANGGTMRLTVPAAWACRFDTNAAISFSGNASVKVSAAGYTGDGSTLSIPVLATFDEADTLVITGLRLTDLRLVSPDSQPLELDFDGDGLRDVYDGYRVTVRALWPGGSYDGWDRDVMVKATELKPVDSGTIFFLR